jgi:P-type conjugative transfer protein TrbJ
MKPLKQFLLLTLFLSIPAIGVCQWTVFDPSNFGKAVQQLMEIKKQVDVARDQLKWAQRSYERQAEMLKGLKDKKWNSLDAINDNIQQIENQAGQVQYMNKYVEGRYRELYNAYERAKKIDQDISYADTLKSKRAKHLKDNAEEIIAINKTISNSAKESREYLQQLQTEMNDPDLSPQKVREINAKLLSSVNQEMIQLKKVMADYSRFAAEQARMAQSKKEDQKAVNKKLEKQMMQSFDTWNDRYNGKHHELMEESQQVDLQ